MKLIKHPNVIKIFEVLAIFNNKRDIFLVIFLCMRLILLILLAHIYRSWQVKLRFTLSLSLLTEESSLTKL